MLPPEPNGHSWDAAVPTTAEQAAAAARKKAAAHTREGQPTWKVSQSRSGHLNCQNWTTPAGKYFGKVYLPGRFSEKLLPENLARMYLKCFIYYANVTRENYKAWVKAS